MLTVDPEKRLSAAACLNHKWFVGLTRAYLSMVRALVKEERDGGCVSGGFGLYAMSMPTVPRSI